MATADSLDKRFAREGLIGPLHCIPTIVKDNFLTYDLPTSAGSLALKDCAVNVELQREVGLTLPVHRECMREIEESVREGLGAEDLFALEKHFVAR